MIELIRDKLNPYLYKLYPSIPESAKITEIDSKLYIWDPNRFDLAIKYVYLSDKVKFNNAPWVLDIYKDHIRAFSNGTFQEGDGNKSNFSDYLNVFEQLEKKFNDNNFNQITSIIPISNGSIIDGSHRVSLAAYYNRPLKGVELNEITKPNYNHLYFLERNLSSWIVDYTYLRRINENKNIRIIHINPAAKITNLDIEKILIKHSIKTEFSKEIKLTPFAFGLLVREYYKNEKWIGSEKDNFRGAFIHAAKSYSKNKSLRVFFVNESNLELLRTLKNEIRDICKINNHSIHINDSYDETLRLANLYLNNNAIQFLNSCINNKIFWETDNIIRKMSESLRNFNIEDFMMVGSFTLSAIGLRKNRDIDIIHKTDALLKELKETIEVDSHNEYLKSYQIEPSIALYNPQYYFFWQNLKLLSLTELWKFKAKRKENKDRIDKLFYIISTRNQFLNFNLIYQLIAKLKLTTNKRFMKSILTRILIRLVGHENYLKLKYHLSSSDGIIKFTKTTLFYPKGYTIIERYNQDGNYEPDLINHIATNFKENHNLNIIDIGANIGLFSVLLLETLSIKGLYLFEPGTLQFNYLCKTFKDSKNTYLYNNAVGSLNKSVTFHTHHPIHTSGDGVIDTKRAGKAKKIIVQQITLDEWWASKNHPPIDLIKIDVEGYEFEVLKGAKNFINNQKPTIYLEINLLNLKNQNNTLNDLFGLISNLDYNLYNLADEKITDINQINKTGDDNFYATPRF